MRLYTLDPGSRLTTNISRISKKIKMNVLIEHVDTHNLDILVVIGDGTPDDIAFSIIAFHLKGDKIAGIVKPGTTRFGVIDLIPTYLTGSIRKIIFLMDQEDEPLNTIYERIQKGLKRIAKCEIKIIGNEDESEKNLKVYECKYGSKEFELILIINGLDEIHTDKHSIEDHFLVSAKMLSIDVGKFENSKAAWESINHDRQLKIFKELKAKREMVESVFPQQVKGCDYLLLP